MLYSENPFWYIASYPKSGNTWCRFLLFRYLTLLGLKISEEEFKTKNKDRPDFCINESLNIGMLTSSRIWIDDKIGVESSDLSFNEIDNFKSILGGEKSIFSNNYSYHKTHDAFTNPKNKKSLLNISLQGCNGAIYLTRRPEDVAISYAYHSNTNFNKSVKFLLNEDANLCRSDEIGGFQIRQYLGRWDHHVNSWLEQKEIPILHIRYEDLKENTSLEFLKILKFLNILTDKKIIKEAITQCSFQNLVDKELKEGFKERVSKKTKFFRSGVVGEGKKYLTKNQINMIFSEFRSTLSRLSYH